MKAMILAAGRGERMGALTADTPKPLLGIDDGTLIERQLRRLAAAGIDDVVINVSWHGDRIRAALGDGRRYGLAVTYSQEPPEPLETAGGIIEALPFLGDAPFLLANADVVSDFDYGALLALRGRGHGTLVLVPNPAHHPDGDYALGADSRVGTVGPRMTYSGISLLSPALFAGLERGRRALAPVFDRAIAAGELYGLKHEGLWIDVGTPERLDLARRRLRGR